MSEEKPQVFLCEIDLWGEKIQEKNYGIIAAEADHNILCHLQILKDEVTSYFSKYGQGYDETETCKKLMYNPLKLKTKDFPVEFRKDTELVNIAKLTLRRQFFLNIRWIALQHHMVFSKCFYVNKESCS